MMAAAIWAASRVRRGPMALKQRSVITTANAVVTSETATSKP